MREFKALRTALTMMLDGDNSSQLTIIKSANPTSLQYRFMFMSSHSTLPMRKELRLDWMQMIFTDSYAIVIRGHNKNEHTCLTNLWSYITQNNARYTFLLLSVLHLQLLHSNWTPESSFTFFPQHRNRTWAKHINCRLSAAYYLKAFILLLG